MGPAQVDRDSSDTESSEEFPYFESLPCETQIEIVKQKPRTAAEISELIHNIEITCKLAEEIIANSARQKAEKELMMKEAEREVFNQQSATTTVNNSKK